MATATHRTWAPTVACLAVLGAGLMGCGSGKDYANRPRPPVPIVITAAISGGQVSVSPDHFGAGPIELVVTNLTGASQQLTLESNQQLGGSTTGIQQQTGPINPQDTASLKANVPEGSYSVHVQGSRIHPGTLTVGASRPSGQNQLLQP